MGACGNGSHQCVQASGSWGHQVQSERWQHPQQGSPHHMSTTTGDLQDQSSRECHTVSSMGIIRFISINDLLSLDFVRELCIVAYMQAHIRSAHRRQYSPDNTSAQQAKALSTHRTTHTWNDDSQREHKGSHQQGLRPAPAVQVWQETCMC